MVSKFSSKVPWREKLERQQEPKIVQIPPRMQVRFGKGTMVIPKPLDVDALIREIPEGKLVTVTVLRERLAKQYKVDVTCPLTTGIFIRIAAEAAEEERRAGKTTVTPYWRVLSHEGRLNPRFPGGVEAQKRKLLAEGHKVDQTKPGKPPVVRDFEKRLLYLWDADLDEPDLFFNYR